MTNFTPHLIELEKSVKSAEELIALAKEHGMELSAEEANNYLAQLHVPSGELSDDELDNVSGGFWNGIDPIEFQPQDPVQDFFSYHCDHYACKICGGRGLKKELGSVACASCGSRDVCCVNCKYSSYENGKWVCDPIRDIRGLLQ